MSTERPKSRATAGFTLVEMVVAIVIAGILATTLFQLIRGQGSFVAFQSAREEMLQNSDGALQLMAGDLRAAVPQGLVQGTANSVTLRVPGMWGISCQSVSGSTTFDIAVPNTDATAPTISGGDSLGIMVDTTNVDASTQRDSLHFAPRPTATTQAWASSISKVGTGAVGNCAGRSMGSGTTAPIVYRLQVRNMPSVSAGNTVLLYTQVKYDMGTSGSTGDTMQWIRRGSGYTGVAQQPLAGPVASTNGLLFRYFAGGSSTPMASAPASDATTLATVRQMRIVITSTPRSTKSGAKQQTDSLTVFLRNW